MVELTKLPGRKMIIEHTDYFLDSNKTFEAHTCFSDNQLGTVINEEVHPIPHEKSY
jgi:hypothetical protein